MTAGAGMVFVRHRRPVEAAFGVKTAYVPDQMGDGRVYPFVTSLQWFSTKRRFPLSASRTPAFPMRPLTTPWPSD